MAHILVIDDDTNLRETLCDLFQAEGHSVTQASNGEEAIAILHTQPPDVAVCDWRMSPLGGLDVLKAMRAEGLDRTIPLIVLTAYGDAESAVQAMQTGAYDFLVKPIDADTVLTTISRAVEQITLQRNLERLQSERFRDGRLSVSADPSRFAEDRLIGRSPVWIEAFKKVGQVAQTDLTVLLEGETGTGKEVVARVIHRNSRRSSGPFVAVNCSAIPEDLVESELFGHERGAFTGAATLRIGSFEQADGGTLFLDEIGEMPLSVQPKLLRVLQEKVFQRLGGSRPLQANLRVIAATNRNLSDEVDQGRFRADLFYRLNAFYIQLPPLRERKTDIALLCEFFLERYAARHRTPLSILGRDALALLEEYPYPGNVRELEQLMNKVAVQASGRPITADATRPLLASRHVATEIDWSSWEALPFHEAVAQWERHLIFKALQQAGGNKCEAAKRLGIHRRLLYEKLQQFTAER